MPPGASRLRDSRPRPTQQPCARARGPDARPTFRGGDCGVKPRTCRTNRPQRWRPRWSTQIAFWETAPAWLCLPIPNVLICAPPLQGKRNNCARSTIRFMRWHNFGAFTNVEIPPADARSKRFSAPTDISEQGTALLRFLPCRPSGTPPQVRIGIACARHSWGRTTASSFCLMSVIVS